MTNSSGASRSERRVRLVDANVLLYAVDEEARQHSAARAWLDAAMGDRESVGFPWIVLLAFMRISTHPRVFRRPLSIDEATGVVGRWLSRPTAVVVHPGPRHLALLQALLTDAGAAGNLVNDAHIAALALEQAADLVSFDRGFGRFTGVRLTVPPPVPP